MRIHGRLSGSTTPSRGTLPQLRAEHEENRKRAAQTKAAVNALASEVRPWCESDADARAFGNRVAPPHLDLTGLDDLQANCLENKRVWDAIAAVAVAKSAGALHNVSLSAAVMPTDAVLDGLRQLCVSELHMAYNPANQAVLESWFKDRLPTLQHLVPRSAPAAAEARKESEVSPESAAPLSQHEGEVTMHLAAVPESKAYLDEGAPVQGSVSEEPPPDSLA
jgi:hypothetical protein